jgi:biotin transporter BioY
MYLLIYLIGFVVTAVIVGFLSSRHEIETQAGGALIACVFWPIAAVFTFLYLLLLLGNKLKQISKNVK